MWFPFKYLIFYILNKVNNIANKKLRGLPKYYEFLMSLEIDCLSLIVLILIDNIGAIWN